MTTSLLLLLFGFLLLATATAVRAYVVTAREIDDTLDEMDQ